MISIFFIYWGLVCDSWCSLSWRMSHMHLRRRCILLHLDGMSWRYQWDLSHLMYHFRLVFLINFLFWWSAHCGEWGVKDVYSQFLLLFLLVFVLCIEVLLYGVHRYLQLLCLLLGLILWSSHNVRPYLLEFYLFKVCFVWYEDCHSSFLLLPICMEFIFPSSQFQSICVFRLEVGFL